MAPWASAVIGITAGLVLNLGIVIYSIVFSYYVIPASRLKNYLHYDDTLDAFGLHGIGGFVGMICTGLFHQKYISMLDGVGTEGGAVDGNWKKVGQQLVACISIAAWSFIMSYAILFIINKIPGLHLRVSAEEEREGQDVSEMGELKPDILKCCLSFA